MRHRTRQAAIRMGVLTSLATVAIAVPAAAHPHSAGPAHQGEGQEIANGQLHPKIFADATSCESYGTPNGGPLGPAWYGLETAHHGPDSGAEPGKGDGCYQLDSYPPGSDVNNPTIE